MERTSFKDVLRENKKILTIGLVCMILISLISLVTLILCNINYRNKNDVAQLQKISQKYNQIDEIYDTARAVCTDINTNEAMKLYNLLKQQPDNIGEAYLMEEYLLDLPSIEGIVAVDRERKTEYTYGSARAVDYTDSYYDSLFAGAEGECISISEKDNDQNHTICIMSRDKYLLCQGIEGGYKAPELSESDKWKLSSKLVGLLKNSSLAVISRSDNTVLYSEVSSLSGKKIDADIPGSRLIKSEGATYISVAYTAEDKDVYLCSITPLKNAITYCLTTVILTFILTGFVMIILLTYIICLQQGATDPSEEYSKYGRYFLRSQVKKFRTCDLLCTLALLFILLIFFNIQKNTQNMKYLEKETKDCVESVEMLSEKIIELSDYESNLYYHYGRIANAYLNAHEDKLTKKGLTELARILDVKYISVVDGNGETVCTSSPMDHVNILENEESSLYQLRYVLMGKEGMTVVQDNAELSSNEIVYAVPNRGTDGVANGLIALITINGVSGSTVETIRSRNIVLPEFQRSEKGSFLFAVDSAGIIITPAAVSSSVLSSSELAEEIESFGDYFHGNLTINGKQFIGVAEKIENTGGYLYVVIPAEIFSEEIVGRLVLVFILFLIASMFLCYYGLGSKTHFEKRYKKVKDADDWKRTYLYWDELSTGQKMGMVCNVLMTITGVALIVIYFLVKGGIIINQNMLYIVSSDWNRSVNVYSIAINIMLLIITNTLVKFAKYVLNRIDMLSDGEWSTASKVLCSLTDYIGAIVYVFIMLTNFGVDTVTAVASLGILGFALSFGAQDLVKDMIAGMFILFEGNYKAGDLLVVNGDWFWVKSIGVRTTTLDAWGTVKVISNSQMTGLINIQNSSACIDCDIMITNDQNLDTVEEILRREIPAIKEKFPPEISSPEYKGVQSIKAQGTTLRIRTYAPHPKQGWTGRLLRREVKRILDENHITLAYESILVLTNDVTKEDIVADITESR